MKDLSELLKKAKEGTITKEEIAYVAEKIAEKIYPSGKLKEEAGSAVLEDSSALSNHASDLYTLIETLGKAQAKERRQLIEDCLDYPFDPQVPKAALETLCLDWGLTKDYLSMLKQTIKSCKTYDEEQKRKDELVRLTSMKCAGEYLRSNPEPELLELLLGIHDGSPCGESFRVCFGACAALCRATGYEWKEIPEWGGGRTLLDWDKTEILEKARQMLKEQCAEQGTIRSVSELWNEPDLTKEELMHVIKQLYTPSSNTDLRRAIKILNRYEVASQYRQLIEKYLYYPQDPAVAQAALTCLCNSGYTLDYLPIIKEFINGVEWDDEPENTLCLAAIMCLGCYLGDLSVKDKDLLRFLLHIFYSTKNENIRENAYAALANAVGTEWPEVMDFGVNAVCKVINKVNNILAGEEK
jgi:hypothetical protein